MPELNHNDPLARLVRGLPEDSPSMAWRAELNEKLRAEGTRQVKVRRWSFGSLGLGLAATCFAALVIVPTLFSGPGRFASPPVATSHAQSPTVAADDLLALDGEGAAVYEISGAGLAAQESDLSEGEVQYVLASQML